MLQNYEKKELSTIRHSKWKTFALFNIELNAKQFHQFLLVACQAWLEPFQMVHYGANNRLDLGLIAIHSVRIVENKRVDRTITCDGAGQLIEELDPLIFVLVVDGVSSLVHEFTFDEHGDDAWDEELEIRSEEKL